MKVQSADGTWWEYYSAMGCRIIHAGATWDKIYTPPYPDSSFALQKLFDYALAKGIEIAVAMDGGRYRFANGFSDVPRGTRIYAPNGNRLCELLLSTTAPVVFPGNKQAIVFDNIQFRTTTTTTQVIFEAQPGAELRLLNCNGPLSGGFLRNIGGYAMIENCQLMRDGSTGANQATPTIDHVDGTTRIWDSRFFNSAGNTHDASMRVQKGFASADRSVFADAQQGIVLDPSTADVGTLDLTNVEVRGVNGGIIATPASGWTIRRLVAKGVEVRGGTGPAIQLGSAAGGAVRFADLDIKAYSGTHGVHIVKCARTRIRGLIVQTASDGIRVEDTVHQFDVDADIGAYQGYGGCGGYGVNIIGSDHRGWTIRGDYTGNTQGPYLLGANNGIVEVYNANQLLTAPRRRITISVNDDSIITVPTAYQPDGATYSISVPNPVVARQAAALVYVGTGSTPHARVIGTGHQVTATAGVVPTGTTGADGSLNVFATNGALYIENRLGGTIFGLSIAAVS